MSFYFETIERPRVFVEINGKSQALTNMIEACQFGNDILFVDPNPRTTKPETQIKAKHEWGWETDELPPLGTSLHGGTILKREDLPVSLTLKADKTDLPIPVGKILWKD